MIKTTTLSTQSKKGQQTKTHSSQIVQYCMFPFVPTVAFWPAYQTVIDSTRTNTKSQLLLATKGPCRKCCKKKIPIAGPSIVVVVVDVVVVFCELPDPSLALVGVIVFTMIMKEFIAPTKMMIQTVCLFT